MSLDTKTYDIEGTYLDRYDGDYAVYKRYTLRKIKNPWWKFWSEDHFSFGCGSVILSRTELKDFLKIHREMNSHYVGDRFDIKMLYTVEQILKF